MAYEAPGLLVEKGRLINTIGGTFSGITGDANHDYGYHIPSSRLTTSDYSMQGALNKPIGNYACAIDIGMDWGASRQWLRWLIAEIIAGRITGVPEVIGSYDGRNVRYWSPPFTVNGSAYTGSGHDTWVHVSIYRSTALHDHRILAGWTAGGYTGGAGFLTALTDREQRDVFDAIVMGVVN